MNIKEAFEYIKNNPGSRASAEGYAWANGSSIEWDYERGIVVFCGGPLDGCPVTFVHPHAILAEWEVVPKQPRQLAPLKRHVASLCRIRWMPMFQAVERADFEGKACRIYLTHRNGLSHISSMLFGLKVYSPNYVTDRWDDVSAVALVDAAIWDKLTDEGKTSVREHHSEVHVFELEPRGEGGGK
jgi:hypothetical protein